MEKFIKYKIFGEDYLVILMQFGKKTCVLGKISETDEGFK